MKKSPATASTACSTTPAPRSTTPSPGRRYSTPRLRRGNLHRGESPRRLPRRRRPEPRAGTAPLYRELEDATEALLHRAQHAGQIRADIGRPEILALITFSCYAADRQHWTPEQRARTLGIIFDGLRAR
jgi:hypothetical protein